MTRPAVFLDRDGVLNEAVADGGGVRSPRTREEFIIVDGAVEAISELSLAGFLCVVVTNQPDVARGRLAIEDADWFSERMITEVGVDAVRECRHDNDVMCDCRKPRPGLLIDSAHEFGIDLVSSWMIGDRWVDIAAAESAGVRSILVDRPWSWRSSSSGSPDPTLQPDQRVVDLAEAIVVILNRQLHQ